MKRVYVCAWCATTVTSVARAYGIDCCPEMTSSTTSAQQRSHQRHKAIGKHSLTEALLYAASCGLLHWAV